MSENDLEETFVEKLLGEWKLGHLAYAFHFDEIKTKDDCFRLTATKIKDILIGATNEDVEMCQANFRKYVAAQKANPSKQRKFDGMTEVIDMTDIENHLVDNNLKHKSPSIRTSQEYEPLRNVLNVMHNMENENSNSSLDISSMASDLSNSGKVYENPAAEFLSYEEFFDSFQKSCSLYTVLNSTLEGCAVLYHYAKHHKVLERVLSKIVVGHVMLSSLKKNPANPFKLNKNVMEQMVSDIFELFPILRGSEKLYFQSGITVRNENGEKVKRTNNTGFLCNAYNKLRDTLSEAGFDVTENNCSLPLTVKKKEKKTITVQLDILYNKDLWSKDKENAKNVWQLSYSQRQNVEFKKYQTFEGLVERFNILNGDFEMVNDLILEDFIQKVQTVVLINKQGLPTIDYSIPMKLLKKWPKLASDLFNWAKRCKAEKNMQLVSHKNQRKRTVRATQIKPPKIGTSLAHTNFTDLRFNTEEEVDSTCSVFINRIDTDYLDLDAFLDKYGDVDDKDQINVLAFLLLPRLLIHKVKSKSDTWKVNVQDTLYSFVEHIEVSPDNETLERFINNKVLFYRHHNIPDVQPYVIICGPLDNIDSTYVIMNNIKYKCEKPIEAFDLCFKIFFVFPNIGYPVACPHIWSFFQKHVYQLEKFGKTIIGSTAIEKLCINLKETILEVTNETLPENK